MSWIWTSIDEADIGIAFCCKFGVQNGRFPGDMDVRVWLMVVDLSGAVALVLLECCV